MIRINRSSLRNKLKKLNEYLQPFSFHNHQHKIILNFYNRLFYKADAKSGSIVCYQQFLKVHEFIVINSLRHKGPPLKERNVNMSWHSKERGRDTATAGMVARKLEDGFLMFCVLISFEYLEL